MPAIDLSADILKVPPLPAAKTLLGMLLPEAGHGADMSMQVSSSGTADLHALVMFAVDASKPFSTPARFP